MKYNIISSFNETYWQTITKENMKLLDKYWPEDGNIFLYHQLLNTPQEFSKRVYWFDLYQTCPNLPIFYEKWKDHPKANGNNGTNFRNNAIKFSHKTFPVWHRAKATSEGWLIWLDADVIPLQNITKEFLEVVCPNNYMISFMGRPGKYSECGFIGFNMEHPQTQDFIKEWEDLYISGKFIELKETHDSWTFDWLRKQKNENLFFNVNGQAKTNKHPFSQSLIGKHFAHAKGGDKEKTTKKIINRIN